MKRNAHFLRTRGATKITMRSGKQQLSFDFPAGISISVIGEAERASMHLKQFGAITLLVGLIVFAASIVVAALQPAPMTPQQIRQTLVRECVERNDDDPSHFWYFKNMTMWAGCDADPADYNLPGDERE